MAKWLGHLHWEVAPEVPFAVFRESGWIDLLTWHAPTKTLLVIEIKTEIVDVQELIGVVDRKVRLAARIGRERGWSARSVATLVVVAEGPTNRRRVAQHASLLKAAFPADGRAARQWLTNPEGRFAGLTFFSNATAGSAKSSFSSQKRIRRPVTPGL